jgi:hypothetical protein
MPVLRKKSFAELAAERQRLYASFDGREVDDEKVDQPEFRKILAVQAKLLKVFNAETDKKVWWKILFDYDETPRNWDNFKVALFMKMKKFA